MNLQHVFNWLQRQVQNLWRPWVGLTAYQHCNISLCSSPYHIRYKTVVAGSIQNCKMSLFCFKICTADLHSFSFVSFLEYRAASWLKTQNSNILVPINAQHKTQFLTSKRLPYTNYSSIFWAILINYNAVTLEFQLHKYFHKQ